MRNNFKLVNADTDSITICKQDGSEFSDKEQKDLLEELNSLFPKMINWEDDGYFRKIVVCKAKNYVLMDRNGKVKIKGSALKATTKEPALREFINKTIQLMLEGKENFTELYHEYIREICNVQDIKRWSTRKTISDKTLNSERTNEARIRNALADTEYVEGDRAHFFYKDATTLELVERFEGQYDVERLLGKASDTAWTFDSVLDCELLFPNFKLKKNKKALEELLK